jgi:hypothetical protein
MSTRGQTARSGAGVKRGYEAGMRITYDERARTVTIVFRGQTKVFTTQLPPEGAIRAGEEYCKSMGWDPVAQLLSNMTHNVPPAQTAPLRTR